MFPGCLPTHPNAAGQGYDSALKADASRPTGGCWESWRGCLCTSRNNPAPQLLLQTAGRSRNSFSLLQGDLLSRFLSQEAKQEPHLSIPRETLSTLPLPCISCYSHSWEVGNTLSEVLPCLRACSQTPRSLLPRPARHVTAEGTEAQTGLAM